MVVAKGDTEKYILSRLDGIENSLSRLSAQSKRRPSIPVNLLNNIIRLLSSNENGMKPSEMFSVLEVDSTEHFRDAIVRLTRDNVLTWENGVYKLRSGSEIKTTEGSPS